MCPILFTGQPQPLLPHEQSEDENHMHLAPAGVAQLLGALSRAPKGHGFDPQSGHIPRLWV